MKKNSKKKIKMRKSKTEKDYLPTGWLFDILKGCAVFFLENLGNEEFVQAVVGFKRFADVVGPQVSMRRPFIMTAVL